MPRAIAENTSHRMRISAVRGHRSVRARGGLLVVSCGALHRSITGPQLGLVLRTLHKIFCASDQELYPAQGKRIGHTKEVAWMSTRVAEIPLRAVVHIDWRLLRGNAAIDLEGVGDVTLVRGVDGENPLWFRVETPDRSQHTVFVDEFEPAITAVDLPATEVPDGNGSDE
jgi:hypothetical protein